MLITDRARLRGRNLDEVVSQAVDGGVNVVQLREKNLPTAELYDLAVTLHAIVRGRALLLVNDRLDVALAAGVDGTHLPERHLPAERMWDLAGDACIMGRSVHSVDGAVAAEGEGADYVLVGTIYETASKPDTAPAGLELVSATRDAVDIPLIAIGGIDATNAGEVIEAGADGIAVIGAIWDADDPAQAATELRGAVDEAYETGA